MNSDSGRKMRPFDLEDSPYHGMVKMEAVEFNVSHFSLDLFQAHSARKEDRFGMEKEEEGSQEYLEVLN